MGWFSRTATVAIGEGEIVYHDGNVVMIIEEAVESPPVEEPITSRFDILDL